MKKKRFVWLIGFVLLALGGVGVSYRYVHSMKNTTLSNTDLSKKYAYFYHQTWYVSDYEFVEDISFDKNYIDYFHDSDYPDDAPPGTGHTKFPFKTEGNDILIVRKAKEFYLTVVDTVSNPRDDVAVDKILSIRIRIKSYSFDKLWLEFQFLDKEGKRFASVDRVYESESPYDPSMPYSDLKDAVETLDSKAWYGVGGEADKFCLTETKEKGTYRYQHYSLDYEASQAIFVWYLREGTAKKDGDKITFTSDKAYQIRQYPVDNRWQIQTESASKQDDFRLKRIGNKWCAESGRIERTRDSQQSPFSFSVVKLNKEGKSDLDLLEKAIKQEK